MNKVRLEHYGKVGENGKPSFVLAGKGKLYINGQLVEGVLEFEPHLVDQNEVAHVVIKLAVSEFTYGPERRYAEYDVGDGTKIRLPIA